MLGGNAPGMLARPRGRSPRQRIGKRDAVRNAIATRPQVIVGRRITRPVISRSRVDRIPRQLPRHDVPRQRLVGGGKVVIFLMRHRADKRKLSSPLGQPRQQFADIHARDFCRDRAELTTDCIGRLRFEIERVMLRQSSRQVNQDDRFGPANWCRLRRTRCPRHHRQPKGCRASAGHPVTTVQSKANT